MIEANSAAQYYLVIDASKRDVKEVLFQLKEVFTEMKAIFKLLSNERIIIVRGQHRASHMGVM